MNLTSFAIYSIVLMLFHNRNNSEERGAWVAFGKLLGKGIYHSAWVGSLSRASAQGRLEMINRNKRKANGPKSFVGKSCQTIAAEVLVFLFVSSLISPTPCEICLRKTTEIRFIKLSSSPYAHFLRMNLWFRFDWTCTRESAGRSLVDLPKAVLNFFAKSISMCRSQIEWVPDVLAGRWENCAVGWKVCSSFGLHKFSS